jgi:hypothetical protein
MSFVPNDPRINRAGRPKGAKDQKWKNIEAIWEMLMKEWDKLTPNERAKYSMDVFKLHFERAIAQLPKDQNDSVKNAETMLAMLRGLEAAPKGRVSDEKEGSNAE